MIKEIVVSVFAALVVTSAQASFKQNITVCLEVVNNDSYDVFNAGFVSSDFFDTGNYTSFIKNGRTCVSHEYKHGPKNIKLRISTSAISRDILIEHWWGCDSFNDYNYGFVEGNKYLKTTETSEQWNFKLFRIPPEGDYEYVFGLTCTR